MPAPRRVLPWLALATTWIVWGSTYMAIRIVVRWLPPFAAASLRFSAAGSVMGLAALGFDRRHGWPTRRQWLDYAVIGCLLLGLGNAVVMWSEQRLPSGLVALVVASVPLWITLIDGLRPGGEAWTLRVWLGALLGFLGVTLIAQPGASLDPGQAGGILALQGAALAWSLGALYSQSITRKLPLCSAAAIEMLAGGLLLVVESKVAGEDVARFAVAPREAWLALLYLAVFGSLVGFTAFAYCLNELPASTVGTYAYVNPVVAVTLGALLLGESLSAHLLGGGALILLAVILTTRRPRPRPASGARAQ